MTLLMSSEYRSKVHTTFNLIELIIPTFFHFKAYLKEINPQVFTSNFVGSVDHKENGPEPSSHLKLNLQENSNCLALYVHTQDMASPV